MRVMINMILKYIPYSTKGQEGNVDVWGMDKLSQEPIDAANVPYEYGFREFQKLDSYKNRWDGLVQLFVMGIGKTLKVFHFSKAEKLSNCKVLG